jgi:hypothetical protein
MVEVILLSSFIGFAQKYLVAVKVATAAVLMVPKSHTWVGDAAAIYFTTTATGSSLNNSAAGTLLPPKKVLAAPRSTSALID